MRKIKTMICAACTLVLVNTGTVLLADSSNFAGPYVAVNASGYGMQLSGTSTSNLEVGGNTAEIDEVSIGQVAPLTGIEAGYAIPLGSNFLLDIGASYSTGEAKLEYHEDTSDDSALVPTDIHFMMNGITTGWIAPTLVLTDSSSVYLKIGLSEIDVSSKGDEITGLADLSGTTWAIGTRTVLDSGIFVKTEAGYSDYNGISAHGLGKGIPATNSYSVEPTMAYGSVSLGFRF